MVTVELGHGILLNKNQRVTLRSPIFAGFFRNDLEMADEYITKLRDGLLLSTSDSSMTSIAANLPSAVVYLTFVLIGECESTVFVFHL